MAIKDDLYYYHQEISIKMAISLRLVRSVKSHESYLDLSIYCHGISIK